MDTQDPVDASDTEKQIADFAEHLNRCTSDDVPTGIAIMGALTFVSALARIDPELTMLAASAMAQIAAELADLPPTELSAPH